DGLLQAEWQAMVFLDGLTKSTPFQRPDSLVSTEAAWVNAGVCGLREGAQTQDLYLSGWTLELQEFGLGGVSIGHQILIFSAEQGGGHETTPAVRWDRAYDTSDFTAFSLVPALEGDLNGDGAVDLLESNSEGALEIRLLGSRQGQLEFSADPDRVIGIDAFAAGVQVMDLDQDGMSDLVILHPDGVEVLVAQEGSF
ncbi:MAG: VCBS repeat-containing protein, partial [Planctomycetes bacterium]|nr:VCBS repeat-containing protein [Planctomycetota bacterium]